MWLVNTFLWKWRNICWNNAYTHWRLVREPWRNSWCVSSGPLRSQRQEGVRRGTDLLGKIPVRENGQGAGGRWESWQTTVQVKAPWKTEEGRKEGWAGSSADWGAVLGRFQQNHWGVLDPKVPITGTSLVVQGLRLCAFTARGIGSIPGWGTKIPQDAWPKTKTKLPITNSFASQDALAFLCLSTQSLPESHPREVWPQRECGEGFRPWRLGHTSLLGMAHHLLKAIRVSQQDPS